MTEEAKRTAEGNIVERLRSGIDWRDYDDTGDTVDWMDEAADEIERLRKANGRLDSINKELLYDNVQKFAELQRLQRLEGK